MAITPGGIAGGGRRTGPIGGLSVPEVRVPRRYEQEGIRVYGVEETVQRLAVWGEMAVAVAGLTSKRVARQIIEKSLDNTPYHSGKLYYSAFGPGLKESGTAGAMLNTDGMSHPEWGMTREPALVAAMWGKYSQVSLERTEGSVVFPRISLENIGVRTFTGLPTVRITYAAGYRAEHAVYVHDNPLGREFVSGTGPRPMYAKTEFFLKNAFDRYAHQLSALSVKAMQMASMDFDITVRPMKTVPQGTALTSAGTLGKPRLVGGGR